MWHTMRWPLEICRVGGGVSSQIGPILRGQRPLNGQPLGISVALGSGPSRTMRVPWASGSGTGTADRSASVYGWYGGAKTSATEPSSTTTPRYITATWSATYRTTARSWEMKIRVASREAWISFSRLMMEACTDTSRADT